MAPTLVTVVVLLTVGYVALIAPTLMRLCKGCDAAELTPEWMERFSADSYHQMERLLNAEDFAFLSRQPGFDMSLYRKLRRDRLRIFRQYLHRMIVDFNRLHLAARLLVSQSVEDRSEVLSALIFLKLRFSVSVLEAEFRYRLCCLGVRTLSVRGLIRNLEELSSTVAVYSTPQSVRV